MSQDGQYYLDFEVYLPADPGPEDVEAQPAGKLRPQAAGSAALVLRVADGQVFVVRRTAA